MSPKDILAGATATILQDVPTAVATGLSKAPVGVDIPQPTDLLATLITTTTAALAAAATSAVPSSSPASSSLSHADEEPTGECRLLGPFALLVQLGLGGLALLSLVYKRWRERPQRPLKIWFFDVSKQVVGSVLVHVANVFMSMLTSGRFSIKVEPVATSVQTVAMLLRRDDTYIPNPCSFYLLNLAIDTTLGIPILIFLLRIVTALASYTPLGRPAESIQSGNYGNPPNAVWWLKQSFIYFCGLFGMKICVLIIFLVLPWIARVGDWALGWTEGNERLQIFFVMMLFPLIMNALQYYIIDSYIKKKDLGHERLLTQDHDDDDDAFADTLVDSAGIDSESDDPGRSRFKSYKGMMRRDSDVHEEYDPNQHGRASSSSRHREESGKTLPKELVPHE